MITVPRSTTPEAGFFVVPFILTAVTVPVLFKPGKAVSVTPTSAAPKLMSLESALLLIFLVVGTYPERSMSVLPIRSHL